MTLQEICLRFLSFRQLQTNEYLYSQYKYNWFVLNKPTVNTCEEFLQYYGEMKKYTINTNTNIELMVDNGIIIFFPYDMFNFFLRYHDINCIYVFPAKFKLPIFSKYKPKSLNKLVNLKIFINKLIFDYKKPFYIIEILQTHLWIMVYENFFVEIQSYNNYMLINTYNTSKLYNNKRSSDVYEEKDYDKILEQIKKLDKINI